VVCPWLLLVLVVTSMAYSGGLVADCDIHQKFFVRVPQDLMVDFDGKIQTIDDGLM
jgi:hypothetical protein